jgi:hypothetical protein
MAVASFELGPIRPPSEARSLLLRVTRNCPWNRCAFCPVYRGERFSIRSLDEVLADIAAMRELAAELQAAAARRVEGGVTPGALRELALHGWAPWAVAQLGLFLDGGGRHAFLQDANNLVVPARDLCRELEALRAAFPTLDRVTSYARAHTLTRKAPAELRAIRAAGLTRLHVGLESGSDRVLERVKKGVDSARQIEAGLRAKEAGFELSLYLMPGLGGRELSREHALESARVLSAIDPHVIRLRTIAYPEDAPLATAVASGEHEPLDDVGVVEELRLFLTQLEVHSLLRSDHVLNLFPELEGQLPEEKPRMIALLDRFLALEPRLRRAFVVGRRSRRLASLEELEQPEPRTRALTLLAKLEAIHGDSIDAAIRELAARFI